MKVSVIGRLWRPIELKVVRQTVWSIVGKQTQLHWSLVLSDEWWREERWRQASEKLKRARKTYARKSKVMTRKELPLKVASRRVWKVRQQNLPQFSIESLCIFLYLTLSSYMILFGFMRSYVIFLYLVSSSFMFSYSPVFFIPFNCISLLMILRTVYVFISFYM